jgi:hypothetical protein
METVEGRGLGSVGPGVVEALPMLKPEMVEELLARLGRSESERGSILLTSNQSLGAWGRSSGIR